MEEMSKRLGVGHNTISRILKKNKVKKRLPIRRNFSSAEKNAIARDYQKGLSLKQIMKKHSFNDHHVIYNILNEKGIVYNRTRPGRRLSEKDREAVAIAYQEGMSNPEIMKKFGLGDHHTIYKILREKGILTKTEKGI